MWRKTKSTKTMAARPSGPGKAGAVKSAKNMLTDVVAEGFLWQRSVQYKTDRWKRRYFRLTSAGLLTYYKPQIGDRGSTSRMRPKGGIQLSGDYFVADSLLRSHAFQLSDFATTFYLAADNSKDALSWMFKFRAVLLVLGGEGEDRVDLGARFDRQRDAAWGERQDLDVGLSAWSAHRVAEDLFEGRLQLPAQVLVDLPVLTCDLDLVDMLKLQHSELGSVQLPP